MEKTLILEIIVHFLDAVGRRTQPAANRIRIPLQVEEVTAGELAITSLEVVKAMASYFQRNEALHRLVCAPKKAKNQAPHSGNACDKLFQLVFFPTLDCIEIQEIQHNDKIINK